MTLSATGTASLVQIQGIRPQRDRAERCDLCAAELIAEHNHLIESGSRRIACACRACSSLFQSSANRKLKQIPQRVVLLADFLLSEEQWQALGIPVGLAFIVKPEPGDSALAMCPSAAGLIESSIEARAWAAISNANPRLGRMECEVEALLVNRLKNDPLHSPGEYYIAPIDECYKLAGLIRANWRRFSGGSELLNKLGQFFHDLKQRATQS